MTLCSFGPPRIPLLEQVHFSAWSGNIDRTLQPAFSEDVGWKCIESRPWNHKMQTRPPFQHPDRMHWMEMETYATEFSQSVQKIGIQQWSSMGIFVRYTFFFYKLALYECSVLSRAHLYMVFPHLLCLCKTDTTKEGLEPTDRVRGAIKLGSVD